MNFNYKMYFPQSYILIKFIQVCNGKLSLVWDHNFFRVLYTYTQGYTKRLSEF